MLKYSFPINLEPTSLEFDNDISISEENDRQLSDLKPVLKNNKGLDFDCTIYKMYRGVSRVEDKEKITEIRHDLTSIPAGILNGEFVKTYGHYHPIVNDLSYPEIYQVINGKAIFILQDNPENLQNIYFVFAKTPDIIVIPPNFGHVTINPGQEHLVLANLVFNHFQSIYEPYQKKSGAAYYVNDDAPISWSINKNYKNIPQPKLVRPINPWGSQYLYNLLMNESENLHFLAEPHNFNLQFEEIFQEKPLAEIINDLNL